MSLIVDASVAVKWFAEEPHSDKAEAVLTGQDELIAPEFILAELGSALCKKAIQRIVTREQALQALAKAPTFFARLHPLPALALRAAEIAFDLQHHIDVCFYLALAERERVPLVRADKDVIKKAKRLKGIEIRAL
jgi:predicted nucleic acid-binding protein